jgi:hypothetical protein
MTVGFIALTVVILVSGLFVAPQPIGVTAGDPGRSVPLLPALAVPGSALSRPGCPPRAEPAIG